MTLAELGPTGQRRLSERIGVDPRNAVPVIDGLAERGLLIRDVDPADLRRRVLGPLDSGQAAVRDLTATGAALEQDFLHALDPDDQRQLRRMLVELQSDAIR